MARSVRTDKLQSTNTEGEVCCWRTSALRCKAALIDPKLRMRTLANSNRIERERNRPFFTRGSGCGL